VRRHDRHDAALAALFENHREGFFTVHLLFTMKPKRGHVSAVKNKLQPGLSRIHAVEFWGAHAPSRVATGALAGRFEA